MSAQKPSWFSLWRNPGIAGLVVWTGLIAAASLAFHRGWILASSPAILQALADTVLALLMICLAGGSGKTLVSRSAENTLDPLERASLEAAVGIGVLGLTALLTGLMRLPYRPLFWIVAALGLVLFHRPVLRWCLQLEHVMAKFRATDRVGRIAAIIASLFCLLGLFQVLAPPLQWDALGYHSGRDLVYETDSRFSESDWSTLNVVLSELALKEDMGGTCLLYEIPR